MSVLDDLLGRIVEVERGLREGSYVRSIVEANDAWIVDMNAEIQLYEQGRDGAGVEIMSYAPYEPVTIEIKRSKGQPTNRVTLRDTGTSNRLSMSEQVVLSSRSWRPTGKRKN